MKAQKIVHETQISDYSEISQLQSQKTRDELKLNQADNLGLDLDKMNLDNEAVISNEEVKTDTSDVEIS